MCPRVMKFRIRPFSMTTTKTISEVKFLIFGDLGKFVTFGVADNAPKVLLTWIGGSSHKQGPHQSEWN